MDYDERYTAYQLQRSPLRRLVRRAYLRSERNLLRGPTLDFGCGVGELLATLPPGSAGLEYNEATVAHCRRRGLQVLHYDGFADDWSLSAIAPGSSFQSMAICHVLEHLETPARVLNRLLAAGPRLGIERVLVAVPGRAGFASDPTHLNFVDRELLMSSEATAGTGFRCARLRYFPGNARWIGDHFVHHELQAVFVRG